MADEDYAFQIVGDADKANKEINATLDNLDRIGPRAAAVSRELQSAFNRAETIVNRYNQALAWNSSTAIKQAQALSQAARAQAAYIEQLQREAQMLDSIHGPAQRAMEDLHTLNSLLAKGAINAQEFNQKLAQIRPPANFTAGRGAAGGGGFDVGGAIGGLPGGSLLAGAIGGGVGGAATAGLQMAAGSIHEIVEMSDAYLGLQNRLRALTGSQDAANKLFDELHQSANKTRSDITTTASSFVQFSRATRDMGLSQNQVLAFTEHLNEAIAMSGADSNAASAGLLQLSQAMATGALRGQDLHSIMEQIPIVAQIIQDHLHITAGKFKQMADDGQISAKVIIDAFNEAGPALEQNFANTPATIGQQFQVLKNDIMISVGEMAKEVDLAGMVGSTLKDLKDITAALAAQTELWGEALGVSGLKLSDLTGGGMSGLRAIGGFFDDLDFSVDGFKHALTGTAPAQQQMNDQQNVINRVVAEGTGKLREYDEQMIKFTLRMMGGEAAAKGFADAMFKAAHEADGWNDAAYKGETINSRIVGLLDVGAMAWDKLTKKQHEHHEKLSDLDKLYKQIHGSVDQAYQDMANLEVLYAQGRITLGLYNAELQKRNELLADARLHELAGMGGVTANPTAGLGKKADQGQQSFSGNYLDSLVPADLGYDKAAFDKGLADMRQAVFAFQDKLAADAEQRSKAVHDAWVNGLADIGGSFIRTAMDGQTSFREMTLHMLRDIALLTLKMEALKMIQAGGTSGTVGTILTGILGGIGGGRNGFDYMSNNAAVQRLPKMATGGDMILRGPSQGFDDHLMMWWMHTGESMHVRTAEQRRQADKGGGGGGISITPTVKVLMPRDRTDIVDDSRQGLTTLVKLLPLTGPGRRR